MEFNGNAETLMTIHHKFFQLSKAQTQRSIYKVHKPLRNINNKAYEPDIIAIGPYHRGKDSLEMMEEHKLRYLELLLQRRNENVERYISAIGELEQQARNCYAESISLNSAKFIEMLVLDGCFIIELIRKCKKMDSTCKNDPIFQMKWIITSLQRDLILFENQIPFFVLCKLFDLIEAPNQHNRLIYLVLFFCHTLYPGAEYKIRTNRSSQEIKHLLDLIHSNWRPSSDDDVHISVDEDGFRTKRDSNWRPSSDDDVHISVDEDGFRIKRELRFIHSATELTDANVKFQKRKSCDNLFEVIFENGILLMPPLAIDDRTESFFRNLIAYEQYFPNNQPTFVTDYVRLLDCLINSSRDVEMLSQCGIIDNWLGDNEVVANFFNQLTDSVTGPGKDFVHAKTFYLINNHYQKRRNRAMAVLNRDYFNSPWAYVSFFAALVLLLLTVAQTVLSVLQVV